jgi:hypothetical protein
VVPVGDSVGEGEASGNHTRRASEVPALEGEDPPTEQLKDESAGWSVNSGKREVIGLYLDSLSDDTNSCNHKQRQKTITWYLLQYAIVIDVPGIWTHDLEATNQLNS